MTTLNQIISEALKEDIPQGDITSLAIFGCKAAKAHGVFIAKQNFILSGVDVAEMVFKTISPHIRFHAFKKNGSRVFKGQKIATVSGPVDLLLKGERVALNFLQQLSGVATLTRQFVDAIKPYKAHIMDTRKTIPGLRLLQKKAVRHGGGVKRRLIEVEADTLAQVREALVEGVDMILLDNMTPAQIKKVVQIIAGMALPVGARGAVPLLEVSGGVNLKNVRKFASTGVARISIGALTHSASAVDISLDIE